MVAPMTTGGRSYAFRVPCRFQEKNGYVVADQLRTVDEVRWCVGWEGYRRRG